MHGKIASLVIGREGILVVLLCQGMLAHIIVYQSKQPPIFHRFGMFRSPYFLIHFECPLAERDGLLVPGMASPVVASIQEQETRRLFDECVLVKQPLSLDEV